MTTWGATASAVYEQAVLAEREAASWALEQIEGNCSIVSDLPRLGCGVVVGAWVADVE